MSDILRTVDLSKSFGKTAVLDKLNMAVPEHSVYGLVGPNGAGKTTTIKILMNACRPTGGVAEVFGHDSRKLTPEDFTRIGYVSENQQLPEWMTVEYLMTYMQPFYPTWDVARANQLLHQFELPRDRQIKNLSHGMRMKVALASSLAYKPSLIVLDEPFTGLDVLVRDELIEGVLDCAEGATILVSSHDLSEVESFASHIGYLDRGRVQFSEDMAVLVNRFRQVEVTLIGTSQPLVGLPFSWLNPERTGAVLRFIETRFDDERTIAEIHEHFGEEVKISLNPMPLRAIFVTLARAGRKAA